MASLPEIEQTLNFLCKDFPALPLTASSIAAKTTAAVAISLTDLTVQCSYDAVVCLIESRLKKTRRRTTT